MTNYATPDDLLVDEVSANTADVTLPNGKVVKVRGLSRLELLVLGKGTDDAALIERRNIAACMVEPKLTEKQVEAWQKTSGPKGGLDLVTAAIRDLSGLGEGAQKSRVAEVRDRA
jgi:hypothetical protein